jgi:TonB family protein
MKKIFVILKILFFFFFFLGQTKLLISKEEAEPTLEIPPKLLAPIETKIPEGTLYPSDEVVVTLELDVNTKGEVETLRLQKSSGEPFDSVAKEAGKNLKFSPALLSNGEPTPITITFEVKFKKPIKEKVPFVLNGKLLERGTRTPIKNTNLLAKKNELTLATSQTNEKGSFSLSVREDNFTLFALPIGYEQMKVEIKGQAGETREEIFYLETAKKGFETTIRSERVKSEVTKRVIGKDTVEIIAGTQGDTLKVVQNLPGVARPSFGGGAPILRGSSPGDSKVYLEGQEIPLLYHFGGLRSTFHSAFLDSVEYIPGNFSAYYGRATGGVIDVKVKDLAKDMFRGRIDLNLYDAGFAVESPVSKKVSIGMAFRRSYVDAFLNAFIPDDANIAFTTAPRFYDYQFLMDYRPDENHKFKFVFFGSLDTVRSLFDNPIENNPVIRGELAVRTMFHNLQVIYDSKLSSVLRQRSSILFGYQEFKTNAGKNLYFDLDVKRLSFRSNWEYTPLSWFRIRTGIDNRWDFVNINLRAPLRPLEGEPPTPLASKDFLTTQDKNVGYEPSWYSIFSFEPFKSFIIDPSVRLDWYRAIKKWTFDPRLMVRYEFPTKTELKAGVGLYHQPPSPDQSAKKGGNPELEAVKSLQTSVGVFQEITTGIDFEITGFHKNLSKVVTRNSNYQANPTTEKPYLNTGLGEIYGFELLLNTTKNFFTGWLSYTFQRSLRKNNDTSEWRPFDFDQPHILTALGTFDIGKGWSSGFRFRVVSGNPTTPVESVVFDTRSGVFVPLYGKSNSARVGLFHQLDLRVDKLWTFNLWKLRLYLDIQNVYNRKNPEGISYNYDYSKKQEVSGLPILPILGVMAEW